MYLNLYRAHNTNVYKERTTKKIKRITKREMSRRCVYCKGEPANDVLDVCERCGNKVWGPKMFNAIKSGMMASKERGDLEQGDVS